jgi:tetratricopeptide (TPR) repeat protein
MNLRSAAKALEIKEVANVHFRAKEYEKALDLYSSIINQYDDRVMINTINIARCNRAACYLNLGEYAIIMGSRDCDYWSSVGSISDE